MTRSTFTRRDALSVAVLGVLPASGCAGYGGYLATGCTDESRYSLVLTRVDTPPEDTDAIRYERLSANERELVEKALDGGRYETCPSEAQSGGESAAFERLGERVRAHRSEGGRVYLQYEGRYYQIGLVVAAVIYAPTEHTSSVATG